VHIRLSATTCDVFLETGGHHHKLYQPTAQTERFHVYPLFTAAHFIAKVGTEEAEEHDKVTFSAV